MMKQNKKIKTSTIGTILLVLVVCFAACKKVVSDALPGDQAATALNFYITSDVMNATYSPTRSTVAIYVDKYEEQKGPVSAGTGTRFPTISFGFTGSNDYPSSNSGGINYARYMAGNHQLFFTDVNNTVVLDTTIKTTENIFYSLYLADLPGAAGTLANYKLIAVEEPRNVPEDKTGVRFINLSPDAGDITCELQKVNGDLIAIQASRLAFGQASAYQFFSPGDVASGGLLRFTLSNTANSVKFDTGVTFNPGRSYVVVISGFRNDQQRLVATGRNPDGSIKQEIVTISSNLNAQVRTSH